MPQRHALTITVNDRLITDAGYWQECVAEDQTPYRLISPPQTTMYRQVLSYLEVAAKDMKAPAKSRLHFGEVAIATVTVCLRWGSYFGRAGQPRPAAVDCRVRSRGQLHRRRGDGPHQHRGLGGALRLD